MCPRHGAISSRAALGLMAQSLTLNLLNLLVWLCRSATYKCTVFGRVEAKYSCRFTRSSLHSVCRPFAM